MIHVDHKVFIVRQSGASVNGSAPSEEWIGSPKCPLNVTYFITQSHGLVVPDFQDGVHCKGHFLVGKPIFGNHHKIF